MDIPVAMRPGAAGVIVLHATAGASLVGAQYTHNRATTRVAPTKTHMTPTGDAVEYGYHKPNPVHIHHPVGAVREPPHPHQFKG